MADGIDLAGYGAAEPAPARPAALAVTAADGPRAVREAVAGLGPCAVLLLGAAGSGKSTIARQMAVDGDQALSIDALCQLASGDPYDHEATAAAISALHLLAGARLRRGLTVIVDAVNILPADRRPLVAMARRHGLPAVAVVMATPLSECLARNARRPAPAAGRRWGSRVPEGTVRAQHRQAQQALPLLAAEGFGHVIYVRAGQNGEGQ
jgi:predicted kinase